MNQRGHFDKVGKSAHGAVIESNHLEAVSNTVSQNESGHINEQVAARKLSKMCLTGNVTSSDATTTSYARAGESMKNAFATCSSTAVTDVKTASSIVTENTDAVKVSAVTSGCEATTAAEASSLIPTTITSNRPNSDITETISVFVAPSEIHDFTEESFNRNENECYVVSSEALAVVLGSRGYKRLKLNYCENHVDLPEQIIEPPSTAGIPLLLRPPPVRLRLPDNGRVPPLHKGEGTIAEKIVMAFEEKVIHEEANTIYSPLRLWEKTARGRDQIKDSKFTARCNCYYAIRKLMKDTHPSHIHDTASELERKALDATKNQREALAKQAKYFGWFEACVSIYNKLKEESKAGQLEGPAKQPSS